jgi:hypothetical protein
MKNSDTPENNSQDDRNLKNANSKGKSSDENRNSDDSENLDNETDSASKDITEQDLENDLLHNDPSEGFETDMDAEKDNEPESEPFETIEPDQDNPVNKEFEIGELGNEELKEDELTRDETGDGKLHNNKPSQRKF